MLLVDRRGRAVHRGARVDAHGLPPAALPRSRRTVEPRTVLLVASAGVFLAFVDNTIVSIAFPNMLESFSGATLPDLSWVFNIYNIALAALLVPAGRLADLLGRRRMFAMGVALFTLASLLCALAPTVGVLIATRALQGAGAAMILPASLGLILEAYPGPRRTQAVAMWTATGAVAAGIGPSIGGGLVELSDWRLVFLINLPIGVVVWRMASRKLVESRAPGRREMPDLGGALMLAVAIGTLSLAIIQSESWGWAETLVTLAACAMAGTLFVRRCRSHASPIIDLELLRSRQFAVSGALTIVGSAGFFAVGLANILYLIDVWGYSPLTAGLAGTPAPFLAAAAAVGAGKLIGTRDPRPWIVLGSLVWAVGPIVLIERFSTEPHYLTGYLPGAAILAVGIGITFPLVSAMAVAGAPGGRFAGATALNSAIRQVGAALGVAILVALVGEPSPAETQSAFERAWWFAAICFALVAIGGLLVGKVRTAVSVDENADLEAARPRPRTGVVAAPRAPRDVGVQRSARAARRSTSEFLAEVPLFASLPDGERDALAAHTTTLSLPAGSWLFRQGDDGDTLYVVRSGRLEIIDESPGEAPRVLSELSAGAALGELALICDTPRAASVRVRRDARLIEVSRADFEALLGSSTDVSRALVRTIGEWVTRGRATQDRPTTPATIAVATLDDGAAAARLDVALAAGLGDGARLLTREDVEQEADAGHALSALLDRLELEYAQVVVSAGRMGGVDAWRDACLRQADRVLLVVDTIPPRDRRGAWSTLPAGADLVLLGAPGNAETPGLLDELDPRSTSRVRGGEHRAGDIAVLARRLAGRSVGLVLSGGGARCFTQIGVIEELLAAGVTIDRIGGTSMGGFIGALLAQGLDAAEIDARCYEEWVRRNPLGDYRFPRTSLVRGGRIRAMLERNLPGTIEDLPRSFYCVSVDLIAAEPVVHRRGSLAESVGASMSLPIFAPPLAQPGRLLLDGGLMDNLPTETMAATHEGPVIGVDCSEPSVRHLPVGVQPPIPTLAETIFKVMLLSESDSDRRLSFADLIVQPDYESIGVLEFHMLDRMRAAGRRAAIEALASAPDSIFGP